MGRMNFLARVAACSLALLAPLAAPQASLDFSNSVAGLAGRWAGSGRVVPASGPSEDFRCVATYFPSEDNSQVRQNLRCSSRTQKLDAVTHLHIRGDQITGRWTDNVYSLTGTVSGVVTKDGFVVMLSGQFFNARMTIAASRCEQSVTVIPARADLMREMAAVLRKC